jgi:uncharacterized protein (DUF2141 family)
MHTRNRGHKLVLTVIGLAWALMLTLGHARAAELTVTVSGLQSDQGIVVVNVFSGKKNWLKGNGIVSSQTISLQDWSEGESVSTSFQLEPGEYAISSYQDEDSDGKLDSNFIGIPKEPAGLSNKPKARMGPPRYQDASFDLPAEGLEVPIELN